MKKLAEHLKDEYTTDGYEIKVTSDYKFRFQDEEITIPKSAISVAGYGTKNDSNYIVRCAKKISHSFILKLVDDFNLTLTNYIMIKDPDNNEKWGYAVIDCTDENGNTTFGDGEVNSANLMGQMKQYAFTMLRKRTEDRAVLRYFGLYQKGFYSTSENLDETDDTSGNDYDNMPTREFNKDGLNLEIKKECNNREIKIEEFLVIAKDVLGINQGEKITMKDLNNDQKSKLLEHLRNKNLNRVVTNGAKETPVVDLKEMKKEIKQFKIDKEWSNDKFKSEAEAILNTNIPDLRELNQKNWKALYKAFIVR